MGGPGVEMVRARCDFDFGCGVLNGCGDGEPPICPNSSKRFEDEDPGRVAEVEVCRFLLDELRTRLKSETINERGGIARKK